MENEQPTYPIDPHYQQGFNEGYLVTKHWPEMSDTIAGVKNSTPRLDGFRDGQRQFVLETTKDNRPKWLQHGKGEDTGRDQSKGLNREHDR